MKMRIKGKVVESNKKSLKSKIKESSRIREKSLKENENEDEVTQEVQDTTDTVVDVLTDDAGLEVAQIDTVDTGEGTIEVTAEVKDDGSDDTIVVDEIANKLEDELGVPTDVEVTASEDGNFEVVATVVKEDEVAKANEEVDSNTEVTKEGDDSDADGEKEDVNDDPTAVSERIKRLNVRKVRLNNSIKRVGKSKLNNSLSTKRRKIAESLKRRIKSNNKISK